MWVLCYATSTAFVKTPLIILLKERIIYILMTQNYLLFHFINHLKQSRDMDWMLYLNMCCITSSSNAVHVSS